MAALRVIVAFVLAVSCPVLAQQPNPPVWPASVSVFHAGDSNISAVVNAAFAENGGHQPANNGQFSSARCVARPVDRGVLSLSTVALAGLRFCSLRAHTMVRATPRVIPCCLSLTSAPVAHSLHRTQSTFPLDTTHTWLGSGNRQTPSSSPGPRACTGKPAAVPGFPAPPTR